MLVFFYKNQMFVLYLYNLFLKPRNMIPRCPRAEDRNNLLEMFRASPDRGAFLAEQPVPRVGTFGFMVFKKPNKDV